MRRDRWLVIRVECPSAESAALLAEGLFAHGAEAIEEVGNALVTYLPPTDDPEHFVEGLRRSLQGYVDDSFDLQWEWQPEQDWSEIWKRGLGPRRVGHHFIVTPSWTPPNATPDDVVITIDPQMAFGTGEHASTRGVLRLIEPLVQRGMRVLDLGAGSAILSIAAAKLGAVEVLGVEGEADALISARENVERNEVEPLVRLEQAWADSRYLRALGQFDLITANILSSVIMPLLSALRDILRPRGYLVVAGMLQNEADEFREAATREAFAITAEDGEDDWWAAVLRHESMAPAPAR
jgi:ribosomal protein L11 methyltransferase